MIINFFDYSRILLDRRYSIFSKMVFSSLPMVSDVVSEPVSNFTVFSHFPEIALTIVVLAAWICSPVGTYYKGSVNWRKFIIGLILASVFVAVGLLATAIAFYSTEMGTLYVWYDALISDYYVMFFKLILLVLSAVVLLLILLSFEGDKPAQYWIFILVFTMVSGLTALLSVNDLLSLFVVIEFISLIAYILPILGNPNKQGGILASVKYYVLGAIASAIMLTGVIILSTENGSFNFDEIQLNWMLGNFSTVQFAGIMLILCAFAIKVAVFPAYTWVFDVYSGASYNVLLVFAIISKFSILGFFIRFYLMMWPWLYQHYSLPLCFLSVATIVGGMFGAFYSFVNNKVKAFIGYTGINQIGYIFMGLCVFDSLDVVNSAVYYLVLYSMANLVFIGSFAYLSSNGQDITRFDQISLSETPCSSPNHKYFIVLIGLAVWSMAGLPPFGNFFAKISLWASMLHLLSDFFYAGDTSSFLLFNPQFSVAMYEPQFFTYAVLLILVLVSLATSIISLYYYLGIIGFIISSDYKKRGLSSIPDFYKLRGVVCLLILSVVMLVLCGWGLVVSDLFSVPEFFARII